MKRLLFACFTLGFGLFVACSTPSGPPPSSNPPAQGFNEIGSDSRAIALADSVMEAMGGRKAWDQTRYLGWNFFGRRHLIWDKQEKRARIEIPADSTLFLLDLGRKRGEVYVGGHRVKDPDSLANLVERGISIWINDSYWLVMPYKLKDSGVTLKYNGTAPTQAGVTSEVLTLTFDGVGNTPQNKYDVYVDPATHLITQWDFYSDRTDSVPSFSTPWSQYVQQGEILLSGDRGRNKLSDIAVWADLPDEVFSSAEKVDHLLP